jgi:ABC-type multidrug transport system permease subunit
VSSTRTAPAAAGATKIFMVFSLLFSNKQAILFFNVAFLTFMVIAAVPAFIDDVKIFIRERLNGAYSVSAFVLSNSAASLPFIFLLALISSICTYFLANLREGGAPFFRYVCTLFLSLAVAESLFMFIVGLVPNFLLALGAGASLLGVFMLNCGFFISAGDLPAPVWRYAMI